MNTTLKTLAAGLLLGSTALAPMAYAQGTAPATPGAPAMDAPAATPEAPAAGAPDAAAPVKPMAPAAGDSAAATPDTYLTEQGETQVSANTYIGQSVFNASDENIGSITDLIFEKDGGVVAAVVGVGGFLGIGQKDVAVPMDKIAINEEGDAGDLKLTTTETAESLQAAPEFMTKADQQAASNSAPGAAGTTPTDSTTTSSTTKP